MNDDEDREEKIRRIVSDLDRDVQMPPYDDTSGRGYSKDYKEYKQDEIDQQKTTAFEKLCQKSASIVNIKADAATRKKLQPALRLLNWEISPGMVVSAALVVFFSLFVTWGGIFALNSILSIIPTSIMLLLGAVPLVAGFYTYYKPVYDAQNKVIESSGEMILSVIYMVIYLRSSPNLEGAIRFAALNLEGSIADDLKSVLWDLQVGNYSTIEESLENYTQVWKDYNDDYLEALQLLRASINEPDAKRREDLLQDSVDRMLDGTQEKMKHYAQGLKTPVMILNAMGAMLPVLGMIMLPLVSVFLGGAISSIHLFMLFNMILPAVLYWFMKRVLNSRPPAIASKASDVGDMPERGKFTTKMLGRELKLPAWPFGALIVAVVSFYGVAGYLSFPHVYPAGSEDVLASAPAIFVSGENLAPFPMLMRSITVTLGLGLGLGSYKLLGNRDRKKAEDRIKKIESQFPAALFQLGNKISGGQPAETALSDAAAATSDMEISGLFQRASRNVNQMGMTFSEALFHDKYGAVRFYPSKMVATVMKAILESSTKGTQMAAEAMMTISNYLQNIHKTQERLNDLLEETTTTIKMLSFLLAPVISGVAVGMSQTIITAMFRLSESFEGARESLPDAGSQSNQFSGLLGNLDSAIPPEVLQMVVGIYLIQLLYILGAFHTKITKGEDKTAKNLFTGRILISGVVFYSITVIAVTLLFGGMVGGLAGTG